MAYNIFVSATKNSNDRARN